MSQRTMSLLQDCIPLFSLLQDENRQKILMLLFDYGEMTVNQITEYLPLSRPAVSHHLKLLLTEQLVTVRKVQKERYYALHIELALMRLKALVQSIEQDQRSR
ncbi:ArsR/SmtB family transcription factor [Volucribacter amazonae]|uniref:Transcriptional regulator n=1 Tax=Volucribacter amazonae TaxID=256731 RepID=A0A9X4PD37_9PAST|nr:metalloregulator ArsR/SmtB family transcription factor [Volucribacter amazonae]MDG6895351.1 transcriptional regulator [Volucribacter amazonae]